MTTRLDRLFVLLEQASASVTRNAAATQLGDVQKLHPHELNNLLTRVRQLFHSNSWDTRIAAGIAVNSIIKHVPLWFPNGQTNAPIDTITNNWMSFDTFDVNNVVSNAQNLLASDETSFDSTEAPKSTTSQESNLDHVIQQRKILEAKLGLDVARNLNLGIDSEDLISNDDLLAVNCSDPNVKRPMASVATGIKKIKMETGVDGPQEDWPVGWFSDDLMTDLFNQKWEVRHGAATGLRELIKLQGRCGGRISGLKSDTNDLLNAKWLEDISCRLIIVLALDKFGDYVSDQVIAPVRETSAQTLGSIFQLLSTDQIIKCNQILLQLLDNKTEWHGRHGSLLAFKYLLAVRTDLSSILLPIVFNPIFQKLKDPIDDVSAVAAASLVPVKDDIINILPESFDTTINYLWDSLTEIDDLTSSTSSILSLLSSLLSSHHHQKQLVNCVHNGNERKMIDLVPRLWLFLSHNLTSVRKSVLESLLTLIDSSDIIMTGDKWIDDETILRTALCLLYQRCLTETHESILELLYKVWLALVSKCDHQVLFSVTSQYFSGWLCLMMHPSKVPIDTRTSPVWLTIHHDHHKSGDHEKCHLAGSASLSEAQNIRERFVFRSRKMAGMFLGLLASKIVKPLDGIQPTPLESFSSILLFHLNSKSSIQRLCVGLVLIEWSKNQTTDSISPNDVLNRCYNCLNEVLFYDEIASSFSKLQQDTRDFVSSLNQNKVILPDFKPSPTYTFDQVTQLVQIYSNNDVVKGLKAKIRESLDDKKNGLSKSLSEVTNLQSSLSTSTCSVLSSALISFKFSPEKLNPLIRPLMDSIKTEENDQLQLLTAVSLSRLLHDCPAPAPKVLKNLVTFLCSDPSFTPSLSGQINQPQTPDPSTPLVEGIITLQKMQQVSNEGKSYRRTNSVTKKKTSTEAEDAEPESSSIQETFDTKEVSITRRGSTLALIEIVRYFNHDVTLKLSVLWSYLTDDIKNYSGKPDPTSSQNLIYSLQVLEVVGRHLHQDLVPYLKELLPSLCCSLESAFPGVRHMTSRVLGVLSTIITTEVIELTLGPILDMLESGEKDLSQRQGAVESIACVIESMGIKIVPFVSLLVVPMLRNMSDQDPGTRLMATHCFAQLIQMMPLSNDHQRRQESLETSPNNINPNVLKRRQDEANFLQQLMDPKKLDNYKMPIEVRAELRSYQQDGINWLGFINKFKLHGILCDEMGLGKTLMSICILASDHFLKCRKVSLSGAKSKDQQPSIVICPPTLTGHWMYEVKKFVSRDVLNPIEYSGPPNERLKIRDKFRSGVKSNSFNLIIASYDIVRNDIEFFGGMKYNYCILDEGHIIKNGKTKLSKAIKSLTASHRLILSGTPIQNNVLELWSLFDFLMPGFLGTEKQFLNRFSKPILMSRDAKSSSKEKEAGIIAMESLHRQVLPFVLRRMKEDVLQDLPPKIIQDYLCQLSVLQSRLYEDFQKSQLKKKIEKEISSDSSNVHPDSSKGTETKAGQTHIFQALQYLRKVCNHPKLVLTNDHPEYTNVTQSLNSQNSNLNDINHSSKLVALKQLLLDCGIGSQSTADTSSVATVQPVVNQHRSLIFCQLKAMLDIVEKDLLKVHLPSVTYLRLDGSVPPTQRHSVVHRFNNDPSIDLLLLTTQVSIKGGQPLDS